jgi:hypothetical protein
MDSFVPRAGNFDLGLVNGARVFKLARDENNTPFYAALGVMCAVYAAVLLWDWRGQRYWKSRKSDGANGPDRSSIEGHAPDDEEIDLDTSRIAKTNIAV